MARLDSEDDDDEDVERLVDEEKPARVTTGRPRHAMLSPLPLLAIPLAGKDSEGKSFHRPPYVDVE